ncbi:MAG: ferredoxin [Patescibacteria group bacterium]|jgi:ferredoxin
MKNKTKKTFITVLFPVLSTIVLTGCAGKKEQQTANNLNQDNQEALNASDDGASNTNLNLPSNNNADDEAILMISPNCVGCGRCTRTDPEHFALDPRTGKATVLTEDNLGSTALQTAISNCPAQAILKT